MTFDRAAIMKDAWVIVRRFRGNGETLRGLLSRALKAVWWKAKEAARVAAMVAARAAQVATQRIRSAREIHADILSLENKDRMILADFDRLHSLRAELRAAG